uniref:RING-type domain-containing protein n=2 Tax=Caenorhabditis tropicalis TaxID=1561998 RepID=A0A1I7TFW7_9PELO
MSAMSLVNETSLMCYQCGRLYEPVYKLDENQYTPLLGSCLHSICVLCFSSLHTSDCPICNQEKAFETIVVNQSSLESLKTLREYFMNQENSRIILEIENINKGNCSQCAKDNQKLYVCKCCIQSKDSLKTSSNGKLIILSSVETVSFFCENCYKRSEKHRNHDLISIEKIENIEDVIQMNSILPVVHFNESFFQEHLDYFGKTLSTIELIRKKCEEIERIRCLCGIHNRIVAIEEANLLKRKILFYRENLKEFLDSFEKELDDMEEESEEKFHLRNVVHHLKKILQKVEENSGDWRLNDEEITRIDDEIEVRMLRIEDDYKKKSIIKVEEVDGYFKYRALIQELENSSKQMEKSMEKREKMRREYAESCQKHSKLISDLSGAKKKLESNKEYFNPTQYENRVYYIDTFHDVIHMENEAENVMINRMTLEYNKTKVRRQYAELMILKYFPRKLNSEGLDFFSLIECFKLENQIIEI